MSFSRSNFRLHCFNNKSPQAAEDDVLPLSAPITASSGNGTIDSISVAKGATIVIPISTLNVSEKLWGADAKEFKPERWLNDGSGLTKEVNTLQGYHHLFTFGDGPRICIGKAFAAMEFKVCVSINLNVSDFHGS